MDGSLAQTASLVAHARIHASALGPLEVAWEDHSTFKGVRSVRFKRGELLGLAPGSHPPATAIAALMDSVRPKKGRAPAIRLVRTTDGLLRGMLGIRGRSSFAMEVAFQKRTVHLRSHWRAVYTSKNEESVWDVDYKAGLRERGNASSQDTGAVRDRLRDVLGQIRAFATDEGVGPWPSVFAEALAMLDSEAPAAPCYADVLPGLGYSLCASQLIAACVTGWVFGGMGSWSDFEPGERAARSRYRVLSGNLRSALEEALLTAINDESTAG